MSIVKSYSFPDGEIRGDMYYIKHGTNNFTVIDCYLKDGNDKNARKEEIVAEIKNESSGRTCRFISTHPDNDHIAGIDYLDDNWEILNFYAVENSRPMLCKTSSVGLCKTVADGLKPGSDVANLTVMGYDPAVCYTGRSPLEAASIGVDLKSTDVALRCNIVTLSDEENYEDKTMVDYCAGDISTEEAREIIKTIDETLGNDIYKFYAGVAYRHCLVVDNGTTELGNMTPPHDISGQVVGAHSRVDDLNINICKTKYFF